MVVRPGNRIAKSNRRQRYITVPDAPGLGIENLEDEVIREHLHPDYPDMWADTSDWDNDYSHDRTWS